MSRRAHKARRMRPTVLVTLGSLLGLSMDLAYAGVYEIDWHTIDGGGAMNSTGGGFELSGTIGQPDAGPSTGPMTGGGLELVGGFWTVAAVAVPGDFDGDGDVDLDDFTEFAGACFSGPDVSAGAGCDFADFDDDGDVDLLDFKQLQRVFDN